MTAKKPDSKRGRPPQDFFADPYRFNIAISVALMQLGKSENSAFANVSAVVLGRKVAEHDAPLRRKRGVGMIPPGRLTTYERAWHINGSTASFRGFRTTLRKKYGRIKRDRNAMLWLNATGYGIAAFLSTGYYSASISNSSWRMSLSAPTARRPERCLCLSSRRSISTLPDLLTKVTAPNWAYNYQKRRGDMLDFVKPMPRALPVTVMIDADATATIINIDPAAFTISKRQIATELRDLISKWMEERSSV